MQIPEFPNLIYYAIPVFIATVIIEVILTVKVKMEEYEYKDAATSIAMGLGNVAIGLISKVMVLGVFYLVYNSFHLFEIPFTWWAWILVLFAEDMTYYWYHRISHENRFFWASHIVHHSSQKYNLSTALRQTWTGSFTFNTPSHHRVHHATNPQYLDRNHAGIFIIWDRIFGSFEPEIEKPIYGLTTNIHTFNPIKVAFLEWFGLFKDVFTSKTSVFNKLKYFLKPPGWKHDGTGILATDMRKEWEKNQQK